MKMKEYNLNVSPIVESIEVVWAEPETKKKLLLCLYFPVPSSFKLYAQDRLDAVRLFLTLKSHIRAPVNLQTDVLTHKVPHTMTCTHR